MRKIEVRRMDGATWVRLEDGLAVLPVALVDEFVRDWGEWRKAFAIALESGKAMVGFGWNEAAESADALVSFYSSQDS